jgi:hypothetical protein
MLIDYNYPKKPNISNPDQSDSHDRLLSVLLTELDGIANKGTLVHYQIGFIWLICLLHGATFKLIHAGVGGPVCMYSPAYVHLVITSL